MKPRLPAAEDWRDVQGGAPMLLVSPSKRLIEIIHAYRTGNAEVPYSGPLAVVPTPLKQVLESKWSHLQVGERQVTVPNVLLWELHGHPCEVRSGQGSDGYQRLHPSLVDYYMKQRQSEGWERFDLLPQGLPPDVSRGEGQ